MTAGKKSIVVLKGMKQIKQDPKPQKKKSSKSGRKGYEDEIRTGVSEGGMNSIVAGKE